MTPTIPDLLDVERRYLGRPEDGAKAGEVLERWGLSPIRWAQLVNAALGRREAWECDPVTVGILTRRRDRRVVARSARRMTR